MLGLVAKVEQVTAEGYYRLALPVMTIIAVVTVVAIVFIVAMLLAVALAVRAGGAGVHRRHAARRQYRRRDHEESGE